MSLKVIASLNEAREIEANLVAEATRLETELQEVQRQILLKRGAIQALEALISTPDISVVSVSEGSAVSDSTSGRSARSTKGEMRERRRIVGLLLCERGGTTVNELLPAVNERLGKAIKAHHLRNVLKKFTSDFVKGEEHGVWELTAEALVRYSSDGFVDIDSESDSETS